MWRILGAMHPIDRERSYKYEMGENENKPYVAGLELKALSVNHGLQYVYKQM